MTIGSARISRRKFEPRFTEPEYSNDCYYSDNIFYKSGFGIPNCTAYAWGRVYELLGEAPRLYTGDAGGWFEYNRSNEIYPYGTEPRLGAIACFDNEYGGHVAVVEAIGDGVITFSNSAYDGTPFYLSTADLADKNPGAEDWTFQGYIYPCDYESSEMLRYVSTPYGLNLREYADINSRVIDTVPFNSALLFTDMVTNGDRAWGLTAYNGQTGWCALEFTEK